MMRRILLVDDEPTIRLTLKVILGDERLRGRTCGFLCGSQARAWSGAV
jgi:CheY-like chemotaxis protein